MAQGAVKAGITISIIEEQGGKQAPDLTDPQWDHGSSDGEIFDSIKNGVGPEFNMIPWKDKLKDDDVWNLVNYLRSIGPQAKFN